MRAKGSDAERLIKRSHAEHGDEGFLFVNSEQVSQDNLFFLKAVELKEAPTEIQLLPLGNYKDGRNRPFSVTTQDIEALIAERSKHENDLAIDYEHQTLSGEISPAAGWVKKLINMGEKGLWAVVEWTDNAKKFIEAKEYRYLSPTFDVSKKDGKMHPVKLWPAAITNHPAIDGMVPLFNRRFAGDDFNNEEEETIMELKALLKLLGLDENSTEAQAVEALAVMKNKAEVEPEIKEVVPVAICKALGLEEDATASAVEATVLAMKQTGDVLINAKIKKLEDTLAENEAKSAVEQAMKDGKVPSVQKDWALLYAKRDPEGFATYLSKAVAVVPMGSAPEGGDGKNADGKPNETDLLIAKMFGNTEEDLVNFGN